MKIFPIASSSSGNCTIVELEEDICILIDCGTTKKHIRNSLGGDLSKIKAVFITHEHGDHISGIEILSKHLRVPYYVPEACVEKKPQVFKNCRDLRPILGGQIIKVEGWNIKAFTTKHDSAYSLGYLIENPTTGYKFGYLTDTGYITPLMESILKSCNALFIEADYDDTLLEKYADYAEELKERIRSNFGHLSNSQVLEFLERTYDLNSIDWVVLGHLSSRTNSPEHLKQLIAERFPEHISKFSIAPINEKGEWS